MRGHSLYHGDDDDDDERTQAQSIAALAVVPVTSVVSQLRLNPQADGNIIRQPSILFAPTDEAFAEFNLSMAPTSSQSVLLYHDLVLSDQRTSRPNKLSLQPKQEFVYAAGDSVAINGSVGGTVQTANIVASNNYPIMKVRPMNLGPSSKTHRKDTISRRLYLHWALLIWLQR